MPDHVYHATKTCLNAVSLWTGVCTHKRTSVTDRDVIKIVAGNEGKSSHVSRQSSLVAFRRCCSDMHVSSFKEELYKQKILSVPSFEGQGQRATPVASPRTLKQIAARVVARSRMSANKKRQLFAEHVLPVDAGSSCRVLVECKIIAVIHKSFQHFPSHTQFRIETYRVDLYFPLQLVAV